MIENRKSQERYGIVLIDTWWNVNVDNPLNDIKL